VTPPTSQLPMRSEPLFIDEASISIAWATALCRVVDRGIGGLTPLVVSITDFDEQQLPRENMNTRSALDRSLQQFGKGLSVDTVAGTIFPHGFWRPGVPRDRLFTRYGRIIGRVKKDPRNRNGVYFERLIAYAGAPAAGNQLEYILQCYKRGVRRKPALQASLFDPTVDLVTQAAVFDARRDLTMQKQRGFPCLQQVAFAPDSEHGTLSMSAFYASQYLFKRAYGNYLGLCHLGRFMAYEMGLRLDRVTCYVGFAHLDDTPGKTKLRQLADELRIMLPASLIVGATA
jgi:hypothetical protein